MSASLFETYEREFEDQVKIIQTEIGQIGKKWGKKKETAIQLVKSQIEEAEQTLETMKLCEEYRKNVSKFQKRLEQKNKLCVSLRKDLHDASLRTDIDHVNALLSPSSLASKSSSSSAPMTASETERQKLALVTRRMQTDNELLREALSTTARTIETGSEVLTTLDQQSQALKRVGQRLENINSHLDGASSTIKHIDKQQSWWYFG